ncbi:MAG: hypothetical protein ACRD0S_07215, partial [Acidimicrobiales bacterium]
LGLAAGTGKLAFDSLVQRDAPAAAQGRSFARFEAAFQLAWVVGALIPVVLRVAAQWGYVLLALAAAGSASLYLFGLMTHRRRGSTTEAGGAGAPTPSP